MLLTPCGALIRTVIGVVWPSALKGVGTSTTGVAEKLSSRTRGTMRITRRIIMAFTTQSE
jgi:hypothetical protein